MPFFILDLCWICFDGLLLRVRREGNCSCSIHTVVVTNNVLFTFKSIEYLWVHITREIVHHGHGGIVKTYDRSGGLIE